MAHFAISCPPLPGHLNPFCVLGRALVRRGHRVTIISIPDAEAMVQCEGLPFVPIAQKEFPVGSMAAGLDLLKEQQGGRSVLFVIRQAAGILRALLQHAPSALRGEGVDIVLSDQNEPASATVAQHLGLPFASICTSLPINRETDIPPTFTNWPFGTSPFYKLRNAFGYAVSDFLTRSLQGTLNDYRRRWGLRPLRSPDDSFSQLTQIAQMPAEFDFPRGSMPAAFHYTGPWIDDCSTAHTYNFPFERLDGRPLVYASLGTLQSSTHQHFETIAQACMGLNLQVIISVGGNPAARLPRFTGDPIVVPYAPQTALLKQAALTITHAGMNTTLQALHFGSPVIAIPLAHDQPAIAARLARTGAGIVLSPGRVNAHSLRSAIECILKADSTWQFHASRLQKAIAAAGGVERAADLLEQNFPDQ